MLKYIAILLLIFTLTQCTVQKRLYNKGYSISWNRKFQKEKAGETHEQLADETDEAEKSFAVTDTLVPGNLTTDDIPAVDAPALNTEDEVILAENSTKKPLTDTVYIVSKNVPEGVAAACLLAGSLIGSRVAAVLPTALIGYAFIACAAMFFASLILAIASMIVYRRYRKDYLTNALGKMTFIIDMVIIATVIVLAILIVLLFF